MDAKQIREKLMKRKLKVELLDISLPDLPELDGQIYVSEIDGDDMSYAKERAINQDGVLDEPTSNAAAISRSLISRDAYDKDGTRDRIFSDDDIDFIKKFGSTIQLTLVSRVNRVSGMTADFLGRLASNSTTTQSTASASS